MCIFAGLALAKVFPALMLLEWVCICSVPQLPLYFQSRMRSLFCVQKSSVPLQGTPRGPDLARRKRTGNELSRTPPIKRAASLR